MFHKINKLKMELSHDPKYQYLGIFLEKTRIQNDTCTPTLIPALFTTARTKKQ